MQSAMHVTLSGRCVGIVSSASCRKSWHLRQYANTQMRTQDWSRACSAGMRRHSRSLAHACKYVSYNSSVQSFAHTCKHISESCDTSASSIRTHARTNFRSLVPRKSQSHTLARTNLNGVAPQHHWWFVRKPSTRNNQALITF